MAHRSLPPGAGGLYRVATLVPLASLLAGCVTERVTDPDPAGQGTAAQRHPIAFTLDVNARTRSILIAPPRASAANPGVMPFHSANGPSLSLLAGDVVRLVASNVRTSPVGASAPNRIRVTFDVTIENKLPSLALVAPTWPTPPAPYVILFPLDYTVTLSPGGVTGSDGNSIGVGLPGAGRVTPSGNWNGDGTAGSGAPYGFFNNAVCGPDATADCFRWVAFGSPAQSAAGRFTRTVGFDIDASVAQFRARMIVAADLVPAGSVTP